jgi:hypothetical protein
VYVYVCMYVCMHVCMYVCMYVCIYVCMFVCMYICVCKYLLRIRHSHYRPPRANRDDVVCEGGRADDDVQVRRPVQPDIACVYGVYGIVYRVLETRN